jgi:hypothetical protein
MWFVQSYRQEKSDIKSGTKVKVYFDGEAVPQISTDFTTFGRYKLFEPITTSPLASGGVVSPIAFSPLASGEILSSGGFSSYLPLPFAGKLRITVKPGIAEQTSGYFNFDYHLFDRSTMDVASFTGFENSEAVRAAWRAVGVDPKGDSGNVTLSGSVSIAPGAAESIGELDGPRQVSSIRLRVRDVIPNSRVDLVSDEVQDDGRAHKGWSHFHMAVSPQHQDIVLKRRTDFGVADQRALVWIDGKPIGEWRDFGSDSIDRWRESRFVIPAVAVPQGASSINVSIQFLSSSIDWTCPGFVEG